MEIQFEMVNSLSEKRYLLNTDVICRARSARAGQIRKFSILLSDGLNYRNLFFANNHWTLVVCMKWSKINGRV